jgi:poly-gamma-glutamate synthesis protein (capsule biosynthesis protein)
LGGTEERAFARNLARLSRPFATAAGPARAWDAWLAYYGDKGFRAEVLGILDTMSTEPQKGAAMFRNRITTAQHVELWRTYLTRVMEDGRRGYSRAAYRMIEEYFSRTVS